MTFYGHVLRFGYHLVRCRAYARLEGALASAFVAFRPTLATEDTAREMLLQQIDAARRRASFKAHDARTAYVWHGEVILAFNGSAKAAAVAAEDRRRASGHRTIFKRPSAGVHGGVRDEAHAGRAGGGASEHD